MSQPRIWLKRLGVVAIFSQMGLPPLIFFFIKFSIMGAMLESSHPIIVILMVGNSVLMSAAYIWLVWSVARERVLEGTSPFWYMNEEELIGLMQLVSINSYPEAKEELINYNENKKRLELFNPFFYNHLNHRVNILILIATCLFLLIILPFSLISVSFSFIKIISLVNILTFLQDTFYIILNGVICIFFILFLLSIIGYLIEIMNEDWEEYFNKK